jgi:hypothetical protein
MLLAWSVTNFTVNATVDILSFQVLNVLMALKTRLLTGIVDLNRCIID